MFTNKNMNLAETADSHQQLIAVCVFLLALKYAASAAMFLVDDAIIRYLDWFEIGSVLLILLIVFPIFVWKFRQLPKHQRHLYRDPDGYLAMVTKQAMAKSWQVIWILLVLFEIVADEFLLTLPTEFFVQCIIAIMLAIFSITFFYLSWVDSREDYEIGKAA